MTGAPWDKRSGLQRLVIVPRANDERIQTHTLTQAAVPRKAAMESLSAQKVKFWRPDKSQRASTVLEELGLERRSPSESDRFGAGSRGVARSLPNLGAELALVGGDDDYVSRLRHKLGADYHVIPEFDVRLWHDARPPQPAELNRHFGHRHHRSGLKEARHKAHNVRGQGVICAILDTGIDVDHRELRSTARTQVPIRSAFFAQSSELATREIRGFDPDGHGTHVAGIIGGRGGVAPDATLIAAGYAKTGRGQTQVGLFVTALDWLIGQIDEAQNQRTPVVLNLSLGMPFPGSKGAPDTPDYKQSLAGLQSIIQWIVNSGVLVVAAIGNEGRDAFCTPAAEPGVLSVGSVGNNLKPSTFSGSIPTELGASRDMRGPLVVGFGEDVASARPRNWNGDSTFETRSGTSQAAAYVSGIAALYWSQQPELKRSEVVKLVIESAEPIKHGDKRDQARIGAGLARWSRQALGRKP